MRRTLFVLSLVAMFLIVSACSRDAVETQISEATNTSAPAASAPPAADDQVATNLATFDDLDFNVFTNQKWDELHRSHSKDIVVHWPDGHETRGIEKHIEDLKAMFVYAPDTRIKVHPVKFGSGEWTSVIGEMEGTFTAPMPVAGGQPIPPTGKSFKLPMCTVGRWENGVMVEEYLFWDNQTYMNQIMGK